MLLCLCRRCPSPQIHSSFHQILQTQQSQHFISERFSYHVSVENRVFLLASFSCVRFYVWKKVLDRCVIYLISVWKKKKRNYQLSLRNIPPVFCRDHNQGYRISLSLTNNTLFLFYFFLLLALQALSITILVIILYCVFVLDLICFCLFIVFLSLSLSSLVEMSTSC